MNQESDLTNEQLQLATSRALPAAAELDAETAALREDFLQLGRAVEAASADFDEAALVARLTRVCLDETQPTVAPAKQPRSWVPLVLSAALAAAALVAIVRTAGVWSAAKVADTAQPLLEPAREFAFPDSSSIAETSPAWSDPLDDEIASAQDAMADFSDRAPGLDGSLDSLGSRLRSIFAELEGGSL